MKVGDPKPCDRCKHNKSEQVDQFGYVTYCDKKMPEFIYYSEYGCYKFKKRKQGGYYR